MEQREASIDDFFGRFADCWKTNDGAAVAEFFTDDGTIVNPFGQRADGRPAVGAMYSEFFAGMLKATTTTVTVDTVRAVGADHVLVDAEEPIYGTGGDPVLVVHLTALLRRVGTDWKFVDARPYTAANAPR